MQSNSVCNHMSDKQDRTTKKCDLFIMSVVITDRIGRHEVLLPINQNYDKNLRKKLDIGDMFSYVRQQHIFMTRSVHLLRHDLLTVPSTVLLHCPITSMMCTLSHKCSNQVSDNQSRSREFGYN